MKVAGLDLVSSAPVGDSMEVVGQRSVTEDLSLLVLGVFRKGERVVGGGATEEEEGTVAYVLAELGVGGGGRRRRNGGGGGAAEFTNWGKRRFNGGRLAAAQGVERAFQRK